LPGLFCAFVLAHSSLSCAASQERDPHASLKAAVVAHYADLVLASYQDAHGLAVELRKTLEAFAASPSAAALEEARRAWLAARQPYGQTEAYRFYGGPIDAAGGPEPLLNAWPLDESYIDYVQGAEESGIVNDPAQYPRIDKDLLVRLNERGSEKNISVGFHALEFLLWGQDLYPDGPGRRSFADYLQGGPSPNPGRRAEYLLVCAGLLVENLEALKRAWDPAMPDNYRARFLALAPDEAIQKMLTGIGVLSKAELAGERLFTPYDNQDQEDEHSCFSDNTHRDLASNALGIVNVYTGQYIRLDGSRLSGPSPADLVGQVNPRLNREMLALLKEGQQALARLPLPFDQTILQPASRPLVLQAVRLFQRQGNQISQIAAALGPGLRAGLP
jgi:putative iron-regulated protein